MGNCKLCGKAIGGMISGGSKEHYTGASLLVCDTCLHKLDEIEEEKNINPNKLPELLSDIFSHCSDQSVLSILEQYKAKLLVSEQERSIENEKIKKITVTTCDLKKDYEIIAPVYFQLSNKGVFSSTFSSLEKEYSTKIKELKEQGALSYEKADWGFLYGEWGVGQNEFDKAFFIAVEELKRRAARIGADAIIGMRQDIDLDTTAFSYFYLQMYGTAVKYKN